MEIRIIILNYNGRELLPQCLPSVVEAGQSATAAVRITVLDNQSPDDDLSYVRKNFIGVNIVTAPRNLCLCSYNAYLAEIKEPVVILLNNDIRVDKDFIDPLLEKFVGDPKTFLVAPKVMSFDGSALEAGRSRSGIKWGMFWCDARYPGYEKDADEPASTVSSGFGAFSREKFMALGGYDDRFLPGIMEDVDLCCRAAKAGYGLYYDPRSVVYHMGQASFKTRFGSHRIAVIAHRNNFLFMWKNFKNADFWFAHLFFLPLRLIYSALHLKFEFIEGFWSALWQLRASKNDGKGEGK